MARGLDWRGHEERDVRRVALWLSAQALSAKDIFVRESERLRAVQVVSGAKESRAFRRKFRAFPESTA